MRGPEDNRPEDRAELYGVYRAAGPAIDPGGRGEYDEADLGLELAVQRARVQRPLVSLLDIDRALDLDDQPHHHRVPVEEPEDRVGAGLGRDELGEIGVVDLHPAIRGQ